MANKLDIKIQMPSDAELNRMFDAVPQLERYRVLDQVVTAGSKSIVKRARQLAPRASQADRDKRTLKQRGEANWDIPLWKTIARVTRKYQKRTAVSIIGPKWREGQKAYFNTSLKGRRRVLWGKKPVTLSTIAPQIRNWIVQAFDETRSQQLSDMKAKLKVLLDQMWLRR